MKKHFLILMLMALLPMAGWAVDISDCVVTLKDMGVYPYTGAAQNIEISVQKANAENPIDAQDYTVVYYASDGTTVLTEVKNVGNYYVAARGVEARNYTGETAKVPFSIDKLSFEVANYVHVTPVMPEGVGAFAYDGTAKTFASFTVKYGPAEGEQMTLVEGTDYAFTYSANTNAGAADDENGPKLVLLGAGNFKGEYKYGFNIAPRTITSENVRFAITGATETDPKNVFTYNGQKQPLNFTVTWGTGDDAVALTSDDYDVRYWDVTNRTYVTEGTGEALQYVAPTDAAGSVNAETGLMDTPGYQVRIFGKGNYANEGIEEIGIIDEPSIAPSRALTFDESGVTGPGFVIKKAELTVMAIAQNKFYDGQAFGEEDLAGAQFSISGLVAAGEVAGLSAVAAEGTTLAAAADKYSITVSSAQATIGDVRLTKNYDVTAIPTNWQIKKRTVAITAPAKTITKGEGALATLARTMTLAATDVEAGYTETAILTTGAGAISAEEQGKIASAYNLLLANAEGEPLFEVTDENIEITTYANAIKAVKKADADLGEGVAAVLANYTITTTPATLTVEGAAFKIIPVVQNQIGYGDAYTIGYNAYTTGEAGVTAATIDEDQLVFVIGEQEFTYAQAQDGSTLPTAIGTYTVAIKDGTAVGTGDNEGMVGVPQETAYFIVKKKLNLKVGDLAVHIGDPKSIIQKAGVKYAADGSAFDKDIELVFSLTEATAANVTFDATEKIATVVEGGAKITVAFKEANEFYELGTITEGNLTLNDLWSMDLNGATAKDMIEDAALNGHTYEVTLTGRTLKGGQWNAMVLPFAVEPLKFCQAIGQYAVFNTLSKVEKDESDVLSDKIYFKLEMNEIPANTPFLVKPLNAVDFEEMVDENEIPTPDDATDDVRKIKFQNVQFVGDGTDPVYTGVSGAIFTGTYATTADINSTNWWALAGGVFKHFSAARANGLKFTNAFIEVTSGNANARFFVEEPGDNGATAIKSLNIDTMQSVDLDGWYTVGGMKLQGAPTQKGVYINNGKKVIIK